MILRPLDPEPPGGEEVVDAWPAVERVQRRKYESCWMITQPSHAALAGDIAGKIGASQIPQLDPPLIRAIALHDAGWGAPDAQAIIRSRARSAETPKSFLQTGAADFLSAWTQSIEIAQKECPGGGFIVSRHFGRLCEHRLQHGGDTVSDRKRLQGFLNSESTRQKKLAAKQSRTTAELERLTDLLQLCDLLSLYICSGAQQRARLPEYFGIKSTLDAGGSVYRLDPPLVEPGAQLSFAALRYPPSKSESSREFQVTVE